MFYFFSTLTSADAVQFLKIIIFFIERLLLPPVITRDFREKVDANQRYSAIKKYYNKTLLVQVDYK